MRRELLGDCERCRILKKLDTRRWELRFLSEILLIDLGRLSPDTCQVAYFYISHTCIWACACGGWRNLTDATSWAGRCGNCDFSLNSTQEIRGPSPRPNEAGHLSKGAARVYLEESSGRRRRLSGAKNAISIDGGRELRFYLKFLLRNFGHRPPPVPNAK